VASGPQRRRGRRAAGAEHDRLPGHVERQLAQRAQELAQRRALLVVDEGDLRGRRGVARAPIDRVRARRDHVVDAGEPAPHEPCRRVEARGAHVEAAEHALDELARDLGAEHALGGQVEGADVQRPRVAQRGAGDRGGERLVDVADVERDVGVQRLDRPRDVDRQGGAARGAGGQRLADREHARALALQQRVGAVAGGAQRGPGLAHGGVVVGGRHDQHAMPARRQLLGGTRHEAVDVVIGLPRVRRDLSDGQRRRHGRSG
jgi:hypothetical protein